MANRRGWWKLTYVETDEGDTPRIELSNADWEHIAELVREGYLEGEIVKDDNTDNR